MMLGSDKKFADAVFHRFEKVQEIRISGTQSSTISRVVAVVEYAANGCVQCVDADRIRFTDDLAARIVQKKDSK